MSACLLVSATPAGAGLVSDQAQASQLQQQIIHQGIGVQQLGARPNAAQAKLASLDSRVAATGAQLAADRRATEAATVHLRRVAIDAYMFGSQQSAVLALFDAGNGEQAATGQEYRTLAAGNLRDALDAERVDAARTQAAQSTLRKEQAQVAVTVSQLSTQRQQAQAALHRDATLLSQVHSTIASLQAAAALRQLEAHRAAQEAALAAAQAQQAARAQQESRRHPPPPPVQTVQAAPVAAPVAVSPGTYANPLRAVAALSPERVDQGVDYSGYGPIYAIGDGVVLNTVNGGWPGGTFIAYRLTDGPAVGRVVYVAENVAPAVSVGQRVTAATVLGKPSPDFFLAVCADLGVEPAHCLMVGDDVESDIGGAQRVGMRTMLVQTGKYREAQLRAAMERGIRPDLTLPSIAELPEALALS